MTGEAASRASLDLPGNQEALPEAVAAAGKPVVLLVFSGRPLVLNWAAEHMPAIMAVWFPGIQAGPALANVLLGGSAPSGRLTVSFPHRQLRRFGHIFQVDLPELQLRRKARAGHDHILITM